MSGTETRTKNVHKTQTRIRIYINERETESSYCRSFECPPRMELRTLANRTPPLII